MATTSTTKKSTTSTTKKKTTTSTKPKTPKPIAAEPAIVSEEPKPKPVKKPEAPEKISVFIPLDPYIADRDGQYMIGSDNGRFFKYMRGKEHLLEKGHAEYILFRLENERQAEAFIEANRWKGN